MVPSRAVVDLCSGGAGPVVALARALAEQGSTVPFVLTDLYPNEAALEEAVRVSSGAVEIEAQRSMQRESPRA